MKIPTYRQYLNQNSPFKFGKLDIHKDEDGEAIISDSLGTMHIKYNISSKKYDYHREDGPANIFWNGNEEFYLEGLAYFKEDFIYLTKYKENYKYQL